MDSAVAQLQTAVLSVTQGQPGDALAAIRGIDYPALLEVRAAAYERVREALRLASPYRPPHPGAKRLPTKRADQRAIFVRDR